MSCSEDKLLGSTSIVSARTSGRGGLSGSKSGSGKNYGERETHID
jgi:hypothetical protein